MIPPSGISRLLVSIQQIEFFNKKETHREQERDPGPPAQTVYFPGWMTHSAETEGLDDHVGDDSPEWRCAREDDQPSADHGVGELKRHEGGGETECGGA